ncbi:MAG: hypothetical protein KME08_07080 [Aphanothece sp. CMT-3BRIN-NPC111]|jgi:NO-binding membrane sensor protein with MHYT domain|nr:hypothetical protein [Aphanothece sp. CMT-3BRIN-NPC111]
MTDAGIVTIATYDISLVVMPMAIAVIASDTELYLTAQVTFAPSGLPRLLWFAGGAIAMGNTITEIAPASFKHIDQSPMHLSHANQ